MIAYFDMFSGVSGDMILGSLIDAGLDPRALRDSLARLPVPAFDLQVRRVSRGPLAATLAAWTFEEETGHRHLTEIEHVIHAAGFSGAVEDRSLAIFRRLAAAEGRVHGIPPSEVHFHEVGALDAILDVCGAAAGLELLEVDRVQASAFRTGGGYVETAHGRLPVPAPAVVALLEGWRIEPLDVQAELTTPTGAAIITTLAAPPGGLPELIARRTGYGAGSREAADPPNCLRVILGDPLGDAAQGAPRTERLAFLETNIDDMNPQLYGWLEERLFEAGAREVFFTAVSMKKGRPGVLVSCLAEEPLLDSLAEVLFRETTTIGVRSWRVERRVLPRSEEIMATSLGPVRVKRILGVTGRQELRAEYEECRRLATERGLPLREVVALLAEELGSSGASAELATPALDVAGRRQIE